MRLSGALLTLALSLAGCGEPTLADALADVIAAAPASYTSCGEYQITQDECDGATKPAPTALQCIIDAAASCQAAHVTITQGTVEGDPIYTAYVVSPAAGGGCAVFTILDTRQDQFGGQELTTSRCSKFTALPACPWVSTSGCAEQ